MIPRSPFCALGACSLTVLCGPYEGQYYRHASANYSDPSPQPISRGSSFQLRSIRQDNNNNHNFSMSQIDGKKFFIQWLPQDKCGGGQIGV